MGLRGRTVVERLHADTIVEWIIADGTSAARVAVAAMSPLTGDWLVGVIEPDTGVSVAVPALEDARRFVLGGNGKRYGGHTEVSTVIPGTWTIGHALIVG